MDKEDRQQLAAEKKRVRSAKAKILKALKTDTVTLVKFMNLEDAEGEKAPLTFSFQGVRDYVLYHDQTYRLPQMVIDHLMGCKTPIYKMYEPEEVQAAYRPDPIDPNARITGYKNRFALVPVPAAEQTQAVAPAGVDAPAAA